MADTEAKPKPRQRITVDRRYKNLPSSKKYEAAIKLVEEDGWSQRAAALTTGISRARLGERLAERKEQFELAQERSAATKAERQTYTEVPALEVSNEKVRVPSPSEFLDTYFSNLICWDCGRPHKWLDYHYEMFDFATDPARKRLLFNLPPGHAKSLLSGSISTVYEIIKDRNSMTAIMSKTDAMAELMLGQIKSFLMDASLYEGEARNLVDDFGPFSDNPKLGNSGQFFVTGRQTREKDPTVRAFGLTSHIYGMRAHRIICDDIADTDNQSPEQVESQLSKITQTFQSRLGQSGKLIIVGTRVMPGDIYSRLLELPAYEVLRYPCVLDEESQLVLFPDHFPFAAAELQRNSMSAERWELVYQNSSLPGFGASFQPEHLEKCHDMDRLVGSVPSNVRLVAGLDPAGSGAKGGYTAMVLLGVDIYTGMRYLVDIVNHKQMKTPQIHDQMVDWASRYDIHEFRVEYNGLQIQMFEWDQELKRRLSLNNTRMTGHKTHRWNKGDAEGGVESMATMFHNGQVSIPWGDIAARQKFKVLCDQLLQFGMGQVNDLVMALWFAELGCRDLYKHNKMPMYDPRAPVPARLRGRRVVKTAQGRMRAPTLDESLGMSLSDREWLAAQRRPPVNVSQLVDIGN